jgi:cyclophilin family peptidyl-prolyl cis-trans isomerase
VAQTADVMGGRTAPINEQLKSIAVQTVPSEFQTHYKHVKGTLSMARYSDPNSGTVRPYFLSIIFL